MNVKAPNGKKVKGSVVASFVVEKDGGLSDVKVVGGKNAQVDQQVVQAIQSTAPWQPGLEKGQPVRVAVKVPVKF